MVLFVAVKSGIISKIKTKNLTRQLNGFFKILKANSGLTKDGMGHDDSIQVFKYF